MESLSNRLQPITPNPRVRVGIVTRNRVEILPFAIKSALTQDYPNIEIVILDDGSTDGTLELRQRFPQITWWLNPGPRGYMEARNRMMSEPGADLFLSLDDDSWFLEQDAISIGVRTMLETGAAAVAYDILDDRNRQRHERTLAQPVHTFIGCGHMVEMSCAQAVGLYKPMPGAYGGEEKDLCLRLLDAGEIVLLLPGVHVWHDKTMSERDVTGQHQSGVCNDLVSSWTRCPLYYLPGLLFAKVARHLYFAFVFALRRRNGLDQFEKAIRANGGRLVFILPALSGIVRALRVMPKVLSKRAAVSVRSWHTFKSLSRNPPLQKGSSDFPQLEWIANTSNPLQDTEGVPVPVRVAAIVAAYNRRQETIDTITKLKNCIPPPDEIWLHVDGGAHAIANAVTSAHPDVRVLVSETNLGPGGSRNLLLQHCKCPLVASFDDDSFPLDADYFKRLRLLRSRWPCAAIFTGELCTPGLIPRPAMPIGLWAGSFLGGACVYSRPAFDDKLCYVPLPVAYGMEEIDLGVRLCDSDQRIMFTPWLRVYHNNDSHLHQAPEITAASIGNQALLAYLRYPIVVWPLGAIQLLSRILWLVRHGRINGIFSGVCSIPSVIWRHRKEREPVSLSALRKFFSLRHNTAWFDLIGRPGPEAQNIA